MGMDIGFVTQSKYYHSNFNSAIFDGPVRLYFNQEQESIALQIYFRVQELLSKMPRRLSGPNIFVMLYPDADSFSSVIPFEHESFVHEMMGQDHVLCAVYPQGEAQQISLSLYIESLLKEREAEISRPLDLR